MVPISGHAAVVADWACTCVTIVCLLTRLLANWFRNGLSDASSIVVVLSLFVLVARVVCNVYILKYGTVTDLQIYSNTSPSDLVLAHEQIGSKLSIAARVLVTSFYWMQCSILVLLYRRLLNHIQWVHVAIYICWALIGTSYMAVVLTTLLECRPISLNWKLSPRPIGCARAYGQLLAQCISNILIDMVLLTISAPILRTRGRPLREKVQLGVLFTLGTFCIIVTGVRCLITFEDESSQIVRSFWASVQAAVAACVANAPDIYGSARVLLRSRKASIRSQGTAGSRLPALDQYDRMENITSSEGHHDRVSHPKEPTQAVWELEAVSDVTP